MARKTNQLSPMKVAKLIKSTRKQAWFGDGLGLYLHCRRPGEASWVFRYKLNGPIMKSGQRQASLLGLGPVHTVSLQEARERAKQARQCILDGGDPIGAKRDQRRAAKVEALHTMTFAEAANRFLETDQIQSLKNRKHRQQWRTTLEETFQVLGDLPLQSIDSAVVLQALLPVWKRTPETGSRLRGRVERVFDWAIPLKLFKGENPAREELLRSHLPKKAKAVHHPALPYSQLPSFMVELRARDSVSAKALEFCVLTAARTSEVTGATWAEIDMDAATWSIPGSRMKGGKPHRVPLSSRAIEILRSLSHQCDSSDFVFINGGNLPLSNAAMSELLKGVRPGVTVHGFRSSFRDWIAEQTSFPNHVAEMALAHVIGNKVESAYRRGDLYSKRSRLMTEWSRYCSSTPTTTATVYKIGKRA